LVADDDAMVRTTVSKILKMFGYEVETAVNGSEVIESIDDTFDVVLLDTNMPDMDGFETLSKLNERNYDFLTKPTVVTHSQTSKCWCKDH